MVAIIYTGYSLKNVLNYNEQKVKQKKAECIMAASYPKDLVQLTCQDKLNRLKKLTSLNENTKRNSLHIMLNFHPSDQLSPEKLEEIATAYMNKIGFGKQPYLVYEHTDAGHPHLHIITTNVQGNGKSIRLFNIGRNQSVKAIKEINKLFGLIEAEGSKPVIAEKETNLQKVQYGKSGTKWAITNVLDSVINQYKYTSLAELNAILRLYNLMADGGGETSRIFKGKGLVYKILDDQGKKINRGIKASCLDGKPVLKYLEKKFTENELSRQEHKKRLTNAIDWSFFKKPNQSLAALIETLGKEKIHLTVRQNDLGLICEITCIDHQTKTVFNGSDLGQRYSAKGLLERCREKEPWNPGNKMQLPGKNLAIVKNMTEISSNNNDPTIIEKETEILMNTHTHHSFVPDVSTWEKKRKQNRSY